MERLSPQDAAFIHIEDGNNPMHIGSVIVFEGPAPKYGDFVRLVASKLPLVPRYRQKVRHVPLYAGRPVWVDDPHFTLVYHVRRTAVPSPGGDDELRNLAGRVFAQHLDRARPLWEIWLVEGLRDGRWALIAKTHHAVVDGESGTDIMTVLFDLEPDPKREEVIDTWHPRPEPGSLALLADAALDTVVEPLAHLRGLPAIGGSPAAGLHYALQVASGALGSISRLVRPTVEGLNGPIGPHRRWSWARGSLADVREIRQAFGGTVNDTVLAAITGGFRRLLLDRGIEIRGRSLRTLVPVSVRNAQEKGTYNNRVSGYFADLPVGTEAPLERLGVIREQMDAFKQSPQAVSVDVLTQLSGFAPPMLLALGARIGTLWPQSSVNTVTTNVPGPQFPLYAVGRRMVEAYPYVPIGGNLRVTVAIFSYCGVLNFGITGDYDSMPDLEVLVSGIEESMAELLTLARLASEPPAKAAATRRRPTAKSRRAPSADGVARRRTGTRSAGG